MGRISSLISRLATTLKRLWTKAGFGAEGRAFQVHRFKWVTPGKLAFNFASPVGLPGGFGVGLDLGMGIEDVASDSDKDRDYVLDGAYEDLTGPSARPIQDIIDSLE